MYAGLSADRAGALGVDQPAIHATGTILPLGVKCWWTIPCAAVLTEAVCQGHLVVADVQYPTLWLSVGLIAAAVVGAVVWPGERFTRVVVALALIALVLVGYIVLPQVFDVDQLLRG